MKSPRRDYDCNETPKPKDFKILSGMVLASLLEKNIKNTKRKFFFTWKKYLERIDFCQKESLEESEDNLTDLLNYNFN